MWQLVFLTLSCDLAVATAHSGSRKGMDIAAGKKQYQVQHGACSYTFLLPETDHCRSPSSAYVPNAVQRDAPLDYDDSVQRLQVLENIMENNTQWLMKLENYIQDNMKKEMVEIQQNAVQNQTAVMIEIGTNLLNQTAEQTRKLTDVEAQVLNQTTRLELQLLEHSLSTNKLEKQILDQTSEISKLQDKNSMLLPLLLLSRFSRVRLCATPQMAARQAPPSLGFSRQERWSGLPLPSPMHESDK
uniref:ANGPT2 protein n=1 Tax=Bos taurus TaxID=9913 RepID=A5PJB7_BOVIN|nr:ANGPT2 protein [Bos taurus]